MWSCADAPFDSLSVYFFIISDEHAHPGLSGYRESAQVCSHKTIRDDQMRSETGTADCVRYCNSCCQDFLSVSTSQSRVEGTVRPGLGCPTTSTVLLILIFQHCASARNELKSDSVI